MLEANNVFQYEICVEGHLDERRFRHMCHAMISYEDDVTRITALCADQAALYGILNWLRDLGIPLVSVQRQIVGAPPARPYK